MDYNDSRHSCRCFEEDLQVEAQAKKNIMNAKKGYKDIPQKSSLSDVKSSGWSISFYQSDRDKFEYETEGKGDERSPHKRNEDEEPEYEESKDVDANTNRTSEEEEEEAEEPRQKVKESVGSMKRKGIESDEDSPPRKVPTHRRMAVVYDIDEE